MDINTAIREIVREVVSEEYSGRLIADPELISIEQAAKICGCSRSVLDEIIKARDINGFPAIYLSTKTIRIDKRRLQRWFEAGGLGVSE